MAIVIPNEGKKFWLSRALSLDLFYSQNAYTVRLYKNDYTPVDASVFASFTTATFPGNAPVSIAFGDWPDPSIVANVAKSISGVTPLFDCTGGAGELVYGFFVSDGDDTWCVAAGRFDEPLLMTNGARIVLDPFVAELPLV